MENRKLDGTNFDIVADNIQKLKELFPEAVSGDNEVNIDVLRDIFEEYDENVVTDDEEFYKFTWWGKKEAKAIAKAKTTKTLRPVKNDSKNWDSTNNIYIEGDNLEVIKILLGSYRNKIKMIYIDPPYNTGKDFVYVDKFNETDKELVERTGQLNEDGFLDENSRTDGKYHSKWLNMMYPRLYLAKKLLTDDGVIFISIDDNEVENLKKICCEIFGENNFVAQLNWKGRGGRQDSKYYAVVHEYILVFAKSINNFVAGEQIKEGDNYPKYDELKNRYYKTQLARKWGSNSKRSDRPNLFYSIKAPDNTDVFPMLSPTEEGCWRWGKTTMQKNLDEGNVEFVKKDGNWIVYEKIYEPLPGEEATMKFNTWIDDINSGSGSKKIKNLFNASVFDYPKPISLINKLQLMANVDKDSIILDFYSGSATTAESIIHFNMENNFKNKFILVQIPEKTKEGSVPFKEGYSNICEIGKERIRRAGDKILEESENKDLDVGFKVFKVDETNFIPWMKHDITKDNVEQAILATEKNIVAGRSELDLVYELLLKLNLDLNAPINEVTLDNELKNKIYVVRNGFLLICLDEKLSDSIAEDLLSLKEELKATYSQVVLKDVALDDTNSINIYETLNSSNVEFYTI